MDNENKEIRECFECGRKGKNLHTHGYIEKDGSKHWEFLCDDCHVRIHPEYNKPLPLEYLRSYKF